MHRILWVSLSAALISARLGTAAHAAYTEEDFVVIEEMIEAGNWVNLRKYLLQNPDVLVGDDAFTLELRKFMNNTESLYTALIFEQSMFPKLSRPSPDREDTVAQSVPQVAPRPLPSRSDAESSIY